MSRSTTAYASATHRERVHALELFAGETTPVAVDFTAILGSTPALSNADWSTDQPGVAVMAAAGIDGNVARIALTAGMAGAAMIRCVGSTDAGTRFVQLFVLQVTADATFAAGAASGPASLTATASVQSSNGPVSDVIDGGGA